MSTVHKSSKSPLDLNNVQYYYTELLFKKKKKKAWTRSKGLRGGFEPRTAAFSRIVCGFHSLAWGFCRPWFHCILLICQHRTGFTVYLLDIQSSEKIE